MQQIFHNSIIYEDKSKEVWNLNKSNLHAIATKGSSSPTQNILLCKDKICIPNTVSSAIVLFC